MERSNPMHQERFKAVLVALAILHMKDPEKELDKPRVAIYFKTLEEWDIEAIEAAGMKLAKEWATFPKPTHFRRILEKDARRRRPTLAQPTEGIWCEWCDDLGLMPYWHGENGDQPRQAMRFLEARDHEVRRRPPVEPATQIQRKPPRWTWGLCSCRNSNPNYQQRAKSNSVPYSGPDAEYAHDDNKWGHEEATSAMQRYVPGATQRSMYD